MKQCRATKPVCFLILLLTCSAPGSTQPSDRIIVHLQINKDYDQEPMVAWINFDEGATSGVEADRTTRLGKAPGETLVEVERMVDQPNTYRMRIDSNGDGSLGNDKAQVIQSEASIEVTVSRKWENREELWPYRITYSRRVNKDGKVKETFYWRPRYCAEGRIKINGCERLFLVLDIDGDGLFNEKDSARGTTIGLDRNGDGRILGQGEWLHRAQIIEYCGKSFLMSKLKPDGTAITLAETALRVPKVGESLPSFSLKALDGRTILSEELRGKVYVLDFWASWCKPCVEKFPQVKQVEKEFANKLEIIAINVDNSAHLNQARHIIKKYALRWVQVMGGRGEDDPIWKMFGGMELNRLAIPLYVLVGPDGKMSYAGSGGDNLSQLKAKITQLMSARDGETNKK